MAKRPKFSCPNCGQENFIPFTQIKKNVKSGAPVTLRCGCSFSPKEMLKQLAEIVAEDFGKRGIKLPD